jgi:hypothetical protein
MNQQIELQYHQKLDMQNRIQCKVDPSMPYSAGQKYHQKFDLLINHRRKYHRRPDL